MTSLLRALIFSLAIAAALGAVAAIAGWTTSDAYGRKALSYFRELHVEGTPPGARQFWWPRPAVYSQLSGAQYQQVLASRAIAEADTVRLGPLVLFPPADVEVDGASQISWWLLPAALLAAACCVFAAPRLCVRALARRANFTGGHSAGFVVAAGAARRRAVAVAFALALIAPAGIAILNHPPLQWFDDQALFIAGKRENAPLVLALTGLVACAIGVRAGVDAARPALGRATALCRKCRYPLPLVPRVGVDGSTATPETARCPECGKQQSRTAAAPVTWPWTTAAVSLFILAPVSIAVWNAGYIDDPLAVRWERFKRTGLCLNPPADSPLLPFHGAEWTFAVKQGHVAKLFLPDMGLRIALAAAVPAELLPPHTEWTERDFTPTLQRRPAEAYVGTVTGANRGHGWGDPVNGRGRFSQVFDAVAGTNSLQQRMWPNTEWPLRLTARRGRETFIYTLVSDTAPMLFLTDPTTQTDPDAERLIREARQLLLVPASSRP